MTWVTLIGETLANIGEEFQYLGPNNDCRSCKLKTVCFNLKPGRSYEILSVRDKKHYCTVHEGAVVAVEVKELPILAAVDEFLFEGCSTRLEKKDCTNIDCQSFNLCTTTSIQKEKTYHIQKLFETLECPRGYQLHKAEITEEH